MSDDTPQVFSWVGARAECSADELFLKLTEVIESDVNAMKEHDARREFICSKTPTRVRVSSRHDVGGGIWVGEEVYFELVSHGILVKDSRTEGELSSVKPHFSDDGRCRLRVPGESQPLELWQVSRKGLEPLFFPS